MTQLGLTGMPRLEHLSRPESLPWGSDPSWHGEAGPRECSARVAALELLLSQPPCQRGCARCADVESVYGMELARELASAAEYFGLQPLEGGLGSNDES